MAHHLVVIRARYIAAVLSGKKSIECRLSKTRVSPYRSVDRGDTLWIKRPGGPVVATARVRRVAYHSPLTRNLLKHITERYGPAMRAGAEFFSQHRSARFATIILLGSVTRLNPFRVSKRDRRAWVVLNTPFRPDASLNDARENPHTGYTGHTAE